MAELSLARHADFLPNLPGSRPRRPALAKPKPSIFRKVSPS
jgi:hypothetical protein